MTTCIACCRDLWADELDRHLCRRCTDRISQDLTDLAGPRGLYAQLGSVLTPGAGAGGPAVSGSRTPPVPLRIDVLNLMAAGGPILGPLETWVRDWETHGKADLCEAGTLQRRVDHAVGTLRFNLEWASRRHPAIDEFGHEVGLMVRACRGLLTGERPPRGIDAPCPCGAVIRYTLNAVTRTCQGCTTEYGHGQLIQLTLAARGLAA